MEIKILKNNKNAILPQKAYKGDAGIDLYFCGKDLNSYVDIMPKESVLLDTGLSFCFPSDYCVLIRNRSGVAAKKQLLVGAELIDSNYAGSAFVNLHNVGEKIQRISHGDKIAQFLVLPVINSIITEVNEKEYSELMSLSERGSKALGSSG